VLFIAAGGYDGGMARKTPPDRLNRILSSARDAFARKGFAGTRMEDIATGAGIGRSALYATFANKEAVFRALVNALIAEIGPVLPADLADRPAPELLRQLVAALGARMVQGDVAFLPRLIVGEGRNFPELARFYHETAMICVLGAVERLIIHGVDRDEFACTDPAMAARSVAGGIIFAALWRNVFEPVGAEPLDIEWMAETHAGLILAGLRKGDAA